MHLVKGLLVAVLSFNLSYSYPWTKSEVDCSTGRQFIRNVNNCGQFYQCSYGIGVLRSCPVGLHFNPDTSNCDWPFNVNQTECSQPLAIDETENKNATNLELSYIREIGSHAVTVSKATCPEGTVPVHCECASPMSCKGAFISNLDCEVFSAQIEPDVPQQGIDIPMLKGHSVQAVVTCLSELSTAEIQWVDSGSWSVGPIATCPSGYEVIGCNLLNDAFAELPIFYRINLTLEQCETEEKCVLGLGCRIQAICKRV